MFLQLVRSEIIIFNMFILGAGCVGAIADPGAGQDQHGGGGKADSTAPGGGAELGAIPHVGGTRFRVWAPDAAQVFVEGDFDAWTDSADEMKDVGGGIWDLDVAGATPGQQYAFVMVRGGVKTVKPDPRARKVTSSNGNSVIVDPNAYHWQDGGFHVPAWNEQVIYELHVGSFNDVADGSGCGDRPGTWRTAIEKLDSLADLGVNMIELLPPAEFACNFSWGYNPSFPYAPESAYGEPDDARAFVDAAHARGIGVIVDVVHNHYGPGDLALWCFDGSCYGAGGQYFYADWRKSTPWGDTRPDFGRVEVRDYVQRAATVWLDEYHADGLRWDSTVNIRQKDGADLPDGWKLLQQVNDVVDRNQPWKIMIAEDLQNNDWITRPTFAGGAGFDAQWDGAFFHPIDDAIITPSDADRHMFTVRDAIAHAYNGTATQRVIYTESHDEVANGKSRIPEMIDPGHADSYWAKKRSTLGAAIVMTSPGIPMIFMGQELLQDGYFADSRPLDWTRATRFAGIRTLYRDLIRLRRNWFDTTRGLRGNNVNVFHVNDADKVIAFHRWDKGGPGDDVVIVANFSSRAFASYDVGMPRGGSWRVRFNSDWNGYAPDFGNAPSFDTTAYAGAKDGLGFHASVGVGAYSVVILSQ